MASNALLDNPWGIAIGPGGEIALGTNGAVRMIGRSTCACQATCYDGLQNQGESGLDCGGPCAMPCY